MYLFSTVAPSSSIFVLHCNEFFRKVRISLWTSLQVLVHALHLANHHFSFSTQLSGIQCTTFFAISQNVDLVIVPVSVHLVCEHAAISLKQHSNENSLGYRICLDNSSIPGSIIPLTIFSFIDTRCISNLIYFCTLTLTNFAHSAPFFRFYMPHACYVDFN